MTQIIRQWAPGYWTNRSKCTSISSATMDELNSLSTETGDNACWWPWRLNICLHLEAIARGIITVSPWCGRDGKENRSKRWSSVFRYKAKFLQWCSANTYTVSPMKQQHVMTRPVWREFAKLAKHGLMFFNRNNRDKPIDKILHCVTFSCISVSTHFMAIIPVNLCYPASPVKNWRIL